MLAGLRGRIETVVDPQQLRYLPPSLIASVAQRHPSHR